MIPANELRINNWYYIRNVLAGKDEPYQMTNWTQALDLEAYGEPIPLHSEILEKTAFVYDNSVGWVMGLFDIKIINWIDGEVRLSFGISGPFTIAKQVKYLHQLQSLYFALTGKELNIEL